MFDSKKAQGLSLSFVIVAALGIIILIVIAVIISKNFKQFGTDSSSVKQEFGVNSCEIPGSGRVCDSGRECPPGYSHVPKYDLSCNSGDDINNYCCER